MSPLPPLPSDSENPRHGDQARGKTDKEPAEPDAPKAQSSWGCNELSNMVTFAQLLDDEYNFLEHTLYLYAELKLVPEQYENRDFMALSKLCEIGGLFRWQNPDVRKAIHSRQHSESLSLADQILCENAHEALGEDFVVPRMAPTSNASLVKLPVGMQIRHMIRTLRLDIKQCGSGDFEPLMKLADQLWDAWPALQAHFGCTDTTDMSRVAIPGGYNPIGTAAIRLAVSQTLLSHPFLCIWVRDMIALPLGGDAAFPIRILSEIWSGDRGPADLSSVKPPIDVDARDSEGHSLLHVAILCDKPRIVRELVDQNSPRNHEFTSGGHNLFHYAVGIGSVDCYSELLRPKNAMEMERTPGAHDELPLHIAARSGRKEMVDYILAAHSDDGDYVNAENAWCQTPLMLAPNAQSPHQHHQLSNPPPDQSTPQTSQPIQEDKSSRAGIIGATTGGLTAHLLSGGILSTIGGAMAGAAGAKKISERKREKKQRN
ncbi:unnamed protein product, partial [Colletotrichum noveboracense]